MNSALWIFQVLWGAFFSSTGFGKVCFYNQALWNQARQEVPWFSAVPQDLSHLHRGHACQRSASVLGTAAPHTHTRLVPRGSTVTSSRPALAAVQEFGKERVPSGVVDRAG